MGGGRFDFLGEIPYFIPGKLMITYFATTQCIMNVKTNLDDCIKDQLGPYFFVKLFATTYHCFIKRKPIFHEFTGVR